MHTFEPGQKVIWGGNDCTILKSVEGWWEIHFPGKHTATVRPSELTPADPGPDAEAVKWCEEWLVRTVFVPGKYAREKATALAAFLAEHGIRANPPQPVLTVERVRNVSNAVLDYPMSIGEAEVLIAALTEKQP